MDINPAEEEGAALSGRRAADCGGKEQLMESMESSINILSEDLENSATGEKVPGFTVVADGEFRQVLDGIISFSNGRYKDYFQIVADALTMGINAVIDSLEQEQK